MDDDEGEVADMTTELVPPVAVLRRPRKLWDVALTVTLLAISSLCALGDLLFVGTMFLFMDSPTGFPTFAWVLLAVVIWLGGTIASIVLLVTGRRAWWLAAATLVVSLVPVSVAVQALVAASA